MLSENVHEYPSKTDFGRIMVKEEEFEFKQTFSEESLKEFIDNWLKIYDIATLLSINIFRDAMNEEKVRSLLSPIISETQFKQVRFPNTKQLLKALEIRYNL